MEIITEETFFHNEEVCEVFSDYQSIVLRATQISNCKREEPSFCVETNNGLLFVKFSRIGRFMPDYLSALAIANQKAENCINLPLVSKNIKSLRMQINVYQWIYGKDLRSLLAGASEIELKRFGSECGKLMRKIHQPLSQIQNQFDIVSRFEYYYSRVRLHGYRFEKHFDYEQFFYDNMDRALRGSSPTFVHMDFKPKNIMLENGVMKIVDIDSSTVGDPWIDFYDKAFSLKSSKETYNHRLLLSYFNEKIPEDFWQYFRVLAVFFFF